MNQTSNPKSHLNVVSIVVSIATVFLSYLASHGTRGGATIGDFIVFGAIRLGGLALALGLALRAMVRGEEPFPITVASALLPPLIGVIWIIHR